MALQGFAIQINRLKQALVSILGVPVTEKNISDASQTCYAYLAITSYRLDNNLRSVIITASVLLVDKACSKAQGYLLYRFAVNKRKFMKLRLVDRTENVIDIDSQGNKTSQIQVEWTDEFEIVFTNEPLLEVEGELT